MDAGALPGLGQPVRRGEALGALAHVDRAVALLDHPSSLTIDDAIWSALAWGEKRREMLGYP